MKKQYASYYAYIYEGEDAPSASLKGENMKAKFPGSDYEVVDGDPCGQCSQVDGPDQKIADEIKDWINSSG